MLFGADPSGPGGASSSLVRLLRGDDFKATGTRFWRYSGNAVVAEITYGQRVDVSSASFQGGTMSEGRQARSLIRNVGNLEVTGQIRTAGDRPTVTGVAGILNPTTLPSSTAVSGTLFFGTTDNVPSSGPILTVTFQRAYPTQPTVVLSAASPSAANLGLHVSATNTYFQVRITNPPAMNQPATTFQLNYMVIGGS